MHRSIIILVSTAVLVLSQSNTKVEIPCLALLDPNSTDPEPCKWRDMWKARNEWEKMRIEACSHQLLDEPMCDFLEKLTPKDMKCFATVTNAYYKMQYPPPCPKSLPETAFDEPVVMSEDEVNRCVGDAWNMFYDLCADNPTLIDKSKALYEKQIAKLDECCAANPDVGPVCRQKFEQTQVAQFNVFQNKEDGTHADPLTIIVRSLKMFINTYKEFEASEELCKSVWMCGFKSTYNGLKSGYTKIAYQYLSNELENAKGTPSEGDIEKKIQSFASMMLSMADQKTNQ